MNLLQTFDTIDRHEATLDLIAGRLRLTGSAAARGEVRDAIIEHRDLLVAHLGGHKTGHLMAFCDTCSEPTLTAAKASTGKPRDTWPRCRMTPKCEGRHRPRPGALDTMRDAPAPPAMTQPPRRPATGPSEAPMRRTLRQRQAVSQPGWSTRRPLSMAPRR